MAKRESDEARKSRILGMIDRGAKEFQVARVIPAPAPPAQDEGPSEPPPEIPEGYHFEEPSPGKSLSKRGWVDGTFQYDPATLAASKAEARALGLHFAVYQNIALGLLSDKSRRSSEVQELLDRMKRIYS